jgi:hypothetical protein
MRPKKSTLLINQIKKKKEKKEQKLCFGFLPASFSQTSSPNKPTWYTMKANLGRKIIKLSSEIEDQISVIMTSKPCSSFDISLSLSLSRKSG